MRGTSTAGAAGAARTHPDRPTPRPAATAVIVVAVVLVPLALAGPARAACDLAGPGCLEETVEGTVEQVEDTATGAIEDVDGAVEDTTEVVRDTADGIVRDVEGILNPPPDVEPPPGGGGGDGPGGSEPGDGGRDGPPRHGRTGASIARRAPFDLGGPPFATGIGTQASSISGTGDPTILGRIGDGIREGARRLAFPLLLVATVIAFLAIQDRLDRRDPKLALAASEPDELAFT
jgi:hypothetical protein